MVALSQEDLGSRQQRVSLQVLCRASVVLGLVGQGMVL